MKKISLALLFIICGYIQIIRAQPRQAATGNILSVSDIHFNPFFDSLLVEKLVKAGYRQWPAIFESSTIKQPNGYNSDSNYPLFLSAIKAMKQQNPSPDLVVITGDFLCHSFQKNYARYAPQHPDSLRSFTSKTIEMMAMLFNRYFPKSVCLPVLGNNDSFCGDYMVDPGGEFLTMFAKAWVPLQRNHNINADRAFIANFTKGGYYTYTPSNGAGAKLVLLNTVFFSSNYSNRCQTRPGNPAADELNWLNAVLKQSSKKKEKLWFIAHIPPGIDVNKTINGTGSCQQNVRSMWRDTCNQVFLNMVLKYAPIIRAGFAGHTHMDDFRLLYNSKEKPVFFMHITPAVSPLFANNPGFQSLTYNKASFGLLNSKTYYLAINTSAKNWSLEYDFDKTYGISAINPLSIDRVRQKIAAGAAYLNSYMRYYNMSNVQYSGITQQNWRAYWCATGNLTTTGFVNCYCGPAPVN